MPDNPRDFHPAPTRNCRMCGLEFQAECWDHRMCRECEEETLEEEGADANED